MKKKLFEITMLVQAHSLKGAIEQATGEVVKVVLEDKPQVIKDREEVGKIGFTK